MATDFIYGPLYNADSVAWSNGMLLRISGTNRGVRAQADSSAHLQGLVGVNGSGIVGIGGAANAVLAGTRQPVLCETGLTIAAGDTLYVSATVAGRATNVAPGAPIAIGTVEDTSSYSRDSRVSATVIMPAATAASGGAFPGFGGTLAAVGVGTSGVSGLAARGDHGHATLRAASTAVLNALPVTDLLDGTPCFLIPRGAVFVIETSSLTVDGVRVLASADGTRRWLRRVQFSEKLSQQTDWNVNTATGNNDATGLTGDPVLSMDEVVCRTWGGVYPIGTTACTVKLTGDMAATDSGHFNVRGSGVFAFTTESPLGYDTAFQIIGQPVSVGFSGVMSSVQNGTLGSLLDIHFTDSGIPVSFTASGYLARNLIYKRTTAPATYFWPVKDLGAKTLRMSQQNTAGAYGAHPAIANTNTYNIMTMPSVHNISFPASNAEFADYQVALCYVTDGQLELPPSMFITWYGCSFANPQFLCGFMVNCQFPNGMDLGGPSVGMSAQMVSGCVRANAGVTNGRMTVASSCNAQLSSEGTDFISFQGCNLIGDVNARATRVAAMFFDLSVAAVQLISMAAANLIQIGGAGNTGKIFANTAVSSIGYDIIPDAGMTTDANPYTSVGVSFAVPTSTINSLAYQGSN